LTFNQKVVVLMVGVISTTAGQSSVNKKEEEDHE
jgi:hypothetical protein